MKITFRYRHEDTRDLRFEHMATKHTASAARGRRKALFHSSRARQSGLRRSLHFVVRPSTVEIRIAASCRGGLGKFVSSWSFSTDNTPFFEINKCGGTELFLRKYSEKPTKRGGNTARHDETGIGWRTCPGRIAPAFLQRPQAANSNRKPSHTRTEACTVTSGSRCRHGYQYGTLGWCRNRLEPAHDPR